MTAALSALVASASCGAERAALNDSGSVSNGDLTLSSAWIRPTAPVTNVGAFYLVVSNTGAGSDRVVAASSPRCDEVEIHQTTTVDGVASMARAQATQLAVESGGDLVFEPSGLHVMCLGLDAPIVDGQSVPLTVDFERGDSLTIEARAENR